MSAKTYPELRAKLREIASRTPREVGNWSHQKTADFKRAIKAAHIAANHPLSVPWMLEQRIREVESFHQ